MRYLLQFTLLVLGFVTLTGLLGGAFLLYDTSGTILNLSYNYLSGSPFNSYMWPGVLLLVVIGFGGILTCYVTYKRRPEFPYVMYGYAAVLLFFTMAQVYISDAYTTFNTIYIFMAFVIIFLARLIIGQQHTAHITPSTSRAQPTVKRGHHHSKKHRRK